MGDNLDAKGSRRESPTGAAAFISAVDLIPEVLITVETEPAYDPMSFCLKADRKNGGEKGGGLN